MFLKLQAGSGKWGLAPSSCRPELREKAWPVGACPLFPRCSAFTIRKRETGAVGKPETATKTRR